MDKWSGAFPQTGFMHDDGSMVWSDADQCRMGIDCQTYAAIEFAKALLPNLYLQMSLGTSAKPIDGVHEAMRLGWEAADSFYELRKIRVAELIASNKSL